MCWHSMKMVAIILNTPKGQRYGSIAWLLTQWHLVDLSVPDEQSVVSLAVIASVFGIGMSWSAIRYRISGQYDSEDVSYSVF